MERQYELGLAEPGEPLNALSPTEIAVCGAVFVADPSGALHWPAQDTVVVADLHLEKGSSAAGRGSLLPPYDTQATLVRLEEVLSRLRPARVIALGDSFHDTGAPGRLNAEDREMLASLQDGRAWFWVAGNHDPDIPEAFGGCVCPSVTLERIRFVHEPAAGPAAREVAGHLHPAARLVRRGAGVRRKCFVSNGERMVLPAFGAYTGGLNVLSRAFEPLFGGGRFLVWMLGRDGVFPLSRRQLLGD